MNIRLNVTDIGGEHGSVRTAADYIAASRRDYGAAKAIA